MLKTITLVVADSVLAEVDSVLVAAADQLTKQLIMSSIPYQEMVDLLPCLALVHVYNTGAAFSFLSQSGGWQAYLFIAIALVALINIFFLYRNGIPFPVRDSLKILLASLCMGMAGKAVSVFFMGKGGIAAALLSGMAVSILVYAAAVALLGCLTREEAVQLPVIGKIVKAFWNAE